MPKKFYAIIILFCLFKLSFATLERVGYEFGGQMYYKLTKKIVQDSFDIALFQEPYDGVGYIKADTGFCFITDAMWHRIIYARGCETDQEHYYTKSLGFWGSGINQFKSPHGVAIDSNYNIYIADTDNSRVVKLQLQGDSLVWINVIGEGILEKPWDVEVEGDKLYVIDTGLHEVFRFSLNGAYQLSYGGYGFTQGKFNKPKGIAVFGNLIYISGTDNHRVVCLRDRGGYIQFVKWLYPDLGDNLYLLDIEVDQRGVVYACDGARSKILKFSPGLVSQCYSFGSYGAGENQFRHPRGMFIQDSVIAIIEEWTYDSGIQAYKEKVSIKELKTSKTVFDATEQEITISFKIDDYSSGARITIEDREWNFTSLNPDVEYKVIWDGRHNNGSLFLPGDYVVRLNLNEGDVKTISVRVKGTIKSGTLSPNEHWTEAGEPYVLVGDVEMPNQLNSKLVIDPGVKVMPTGNYGIYPPVYFSGGSTLLARGSAINKILFTPHRKLYPISDSVPKGFWKGIARRWVSSDRSFERLVFDHCIIEAAGSDSGAIWASPRTKYVSITNTEISKSGGYGLYCDYFRCDTVLVNNCQFTDNDSIPIIAPFKFIGEIYGNSFVNNKPDVIAIVGETRRTDATIYNQGVPYWFLKGEFVVEASNDTYCPTLTVQPGVKILFDDSSGLYLGVYPSPIRGKIFAQGKADSMIIFSALDTTKHWRGIHIADNNVADTSRFEYCEVSYGGRILNTWFDRSGGNIGFLYDHTPYILQNSRIVRSLNFGCGCFYTTSGQNSLVSVIKNNQFIDNDSFPLILGANELGECEDNVFIGNGMNSILIKGERIDHNITIRNQGVPYTVHWYWDWITIDGVNSLARVMIEDGNTLRFAGGALAISDSGILKTRGVIFTALDTAWGGIKFDYAESDTSVLDSCIVEKAGFFPTGNWPYGAIHMNGSRLIITNSVIINNEKGLWLAYQNKLNMTNNLFAQNRIGIYRASSDFIPDSIKIKNNEFWGNKIAVVNTGTSKILKADSNWWGDETGPWDPSTRVPDYNPSGRGDSIGDYVIYRPWLTSPVQPQVVTLLQPNGGEVLYCGQSYEIKWRLGDKGMGRQGDGEIKGIRLSGDQDIRDKSQISNHKSQINSNIQIPNKIRDEILKQVQNDTLTPTLYLQGRGGKGQSQILRQELYYTTDFPEGGKAEVFWRFIDTVPVGETSYVWQVPNTPSNRCRVAVKIYYDDGKSQISNPKSQTNSKIQILNKIRDEILNQHVKQVQGRIQNDIADKNLSSNFPLLTSDGCAIGVDISDGNWTIGLATDFALSTAYNQGKKILTSPTGNKVHFVYANEGLTLASGVFYCYSQDSGKTFEFPEMVDSSGLYPALSLDPQGNPCASWVSGSGIYFTYWTSSWAPPDTIVLPVENVSPPSMVCDDKDTVHLVYVQYYQLPSDTGDLVYLKFKRTNFEGAVKETLLYHIFCRTPSLALDELRNTHILWQSANCVCYQKKDSNGWSGVDTIYTTTTNERLYPVIDVYGNKVVGVWQDKDVSGNLEIFSRRKIDTGWEEIKKVAQTLGDSKFPVLANANYCLWQDNSGGNWEVYKSEYVDTAGIWLEPENLSNTLTQSTFPHCAYALVNGTMAKLHILWTEGDTIPYPIEFKRIDVLPVAKIFVDVGNSIQSSYCLQRDGYWVFGDRPYQTTDWGYENLRYRISGLDPQRDYRLDLAYYFRNEAIEGNSGQLEIKGESKVIKGKQGLSGNDICSVRLQSDEKIRPSKDGRYEYELEKPDRPDRPDRRERPDGIGRIIQVLVIDGIGLDTAFITPNHLRRISVWLPASVYGDGEIIIEIKKIKGKRVVLSEIGLYEFPEEKIKITSGPQGEEAQISRTFYLERIYPNPFKDKVIIRYMIQDTRYMIPDINLKIYDVSGRMVRDFSRLTVNGERSTIVWDGTDDSGRRLPSGVYFIQLEDGEFKDTEKVILLR